MRRFLKSSIYPLFSQLYITIWIIGSVLAAAAGPFETYGHHAFPQRFMFWMLVFASSTALARICSRLTHMMFGMSHPILADVVKVLAMVAVFTPILFVLIEVLVTDTVLSNPGILVLAQNVAIVTAAICIARRVLPGFERVSYGKSKKEISPPETTSPSAYRPRLMRRLPETFQGPIVRLAVRDHLVEVVTQVDSHTIRIRFLDAIDEMDDIPGFCTHRSHWVTRDAIVGVERENNRAFLRMSNHDIVPISRKYKPDLERAGIL